MLGCWPVLGTTWHTWRSYANYCVTTRDPVRPSHPEEFPFSDGLQKLGNLTGPPFTAGTSPTPATAQVSLTLIFFQPGPLHWQCHTEGSHFLPFWLIFRRDPLRSDKQPALGHPDEAGQAPGSEELLTQLLGECLCLGLCLFVLLGFLWSWTGDRPGIMNL